MTTDTPDTPQLFEMVAHYFPNAEPMFFGRPDFDSAEVPWHDSRLIVTRDEETEGRYLLGIYTEESWTDGSGEPLAFLTLPTRERVVEILNYLTENTPEGVSFPDWAAQRAADAGEDMDADAEPSAIAKYAEVLFQLISDDVAAEPERFAAVVSWEGLSTVCDENEYLIAADEQTGNPSPFDTDGPVDEDALAAYASFTTAAIDLAEVMLGWQ